jgi:hypothetical protein
MKTFSIFAACVMMAAMLLFSSPARAQTTAVHALHFDLGVDAGYPTGNLTIGSNFVLGGTARLAYGITNDFAVTFTSGADHFFSKINPATGHKYDSFGTIPIKAGGKYFFIPHIYVGVEGGIAKEEVDSGHGNTKTLVSSSLGWANKEWDVGVRYDNFSGQSDPYGFVVLRVAYGF